MTWTYSGNPAASARDAVRFLIGDTDEDNQLLTDSEITFLIAESDSNKYLAAASGCDILASKFSSKSDSSKSVGDLSLSTQFGAQAQAFRQQAETLRARAAIVNPPSVNFFTDANGDVFGAMEFKIGMDRFT